MTIEMLPWIIARATGFAAFGLISTAMIAACWFERVEVSDR